MKMAVQYEDNILPDLKPLLDENLRLTAIPAKNKKSFRLFITLREKLNRTVIIRNPESMAFLMI